MRDRGGEVGGKALSEQLQSSEVPTPGRQTQVQRVAIPASAIAPPVQAKPAETSDPVPEMPSYASIRALFGDRSIQARATTSAAGDVHAAAAHGISGSASQLPHLEQIQRSFGRHDVSRVQAHTGPEAKVGSQAMGAEAFATGDHVAFAGAPSLHLAAHEAAHVVQQKGGVQLAGGVGAAGDTYERHADAVADAVVRGESAEALLDLHAGGGAASGPVQQAPVQRKVDTHYGEWFDDRYITTQSGSRRGVEIDLRFKPNARVDAELIGLTQTLRSTKQGTPYVLNNDPTRMDHSIKAADAKTVNTATGRTDEGTQIDQAEYNRNPPCVAG